MVKMKNRNVPGYHPFRSEDAGARFYNLCEIFEQQWPEPFDIKMADTSFGKTFVRINGPADAQPLVLLHGMGSNSLLGWLDQVKELSENFRTYAVDDICGFGKSVCTRPVKSGDDYIQWLDELFNSLGLERGINLMGMSYGAWQTALYALNRSERLNRIVMLAPPEVVLHCGFRLRMRLLLSMVTGGLTYKRTLRWLFDDLFKKDSEYAEEAVELLIQVSKCFRPVRLPDPTLFTDKELGNIDVPALYIIGENDKIYSAHDAIRRLNIVVPWIKTEMIKGAGHDMQALQPCLINRLVTGFLES